MHQLTTNLHIFATTNIKTSQQMKISQISLSVAMSALLLATGCNYSEEDDIIVSQRSKEAIERSQQNKDYTVWQFIRGTAYIFYLWNEKVPSNNIDYSKYATPEALFESFRHEDDRFSVVVNNYTEISNQFNNTFESDGTEYQLFLDGETGNNVIAIVDYVYDDSPAQKAGVKRGYVIHKVNGTQLNTDNYAELLDQKTCTYTYSELKTVEENGNVSLSYGDDLRETPAITKESMAIDPVLKTSVFVKDGKRIGYFLYDAFTQETDGIIKAVEKLEAQQIDELVLDLRLNGGGYINTLDTLASMLVPDGNEGKLFIQENFNDIYTAELLRKSKDRNFNKSFFAANLPNLHLSRLYVLTSGCTASASEELISGLQPYMPVTIIGETTVGKFTSNFLINDIDDKGTDPDGIPYNEWAIYLCVASCTNSLGEMNFKDGFKPDYPVVDTHQHELGDENEPLLAKAIELCTGEAISKSMRPSPTPLQGYVGHHGKPINNYGLISAKK